MKNISYLSIFGFILALLGTSSLAQAKSDVFGTGAKEADALAVNQVLETPDSFLDKEVTVAGEIVSVCDKKGCWMMLSSGDERLRIKVKDGEMVFPFNAKGKTAFATGKLEKMEMTREKAIAYLKHMAEDAGKEFDESTVKGDMTFYQLRPVGVTIKR
ncbi:DUF4920 domain-containing protein [Pleionea sediminis]|uniref:DUF4920 domain-containing protein n=1 Tax=Pleionea sediminis TaxID=2569479 RepID=UPI0011871A2D|nr:DUF4920 domain-containing protein [Pleionea sediminis]